MSQRQLTLLGLPLDIKILICRHIMDVWIFFAIYDDSVYKYTQRNINTFIDLFTIHITTGAVESWKIFNKIHRKDDRPAVITAKNRYWYQNDKIHRDGDKYAMCSEHVFVWKRYGITHRESRIDGIPQPAYVDNILNEQYYYCNGKFHSYKRDDNRLHPSVLCRDEIQYHKHGKLHRWEFSAHKIQPASKNGEKIQYYVYGCNITTPCNIYNRMVSLFT